MACLRYWISFVLDYVAQPPLSSIFSLTKRVPKTNNKVGVALILIDKMMDLATCVLYFIARG